MRKGIIYICRYRAFYPGNFIASIEKLAIAAHRDGYEVYFLFPDSVKQHDWIQALPVPPENLMFSDFSKRHLYSFCRQFVHEHRGIHMTAHTHFLSGLSLLAVRLCFDQCFCHFHMTVKKPVSLYRKMRRLLVRFFYRNCIIIGVSDVVSRDLKAFFPHNIVENVPNAIDFDYISGNLCSGEIPEYLDSNTFRILIHGTNFHTKGVDTAVRAVASLNKKQVPCKLYITTHSVDATNSFLTSLGEDLSMIQPIHVVKDIMDVYNNVELFLSPSREEAFGYAVAEAAYSNCLVIASDVPGQNTMKDIPGICWIQPDNDAQLEAAILDAVSFSGTEQAQAMKSRQKAYVVSEYNIDKWVNKTLEVYRRHQ